MQSRLSLDKFAEGFVSACRAMSVDPEALVKLSQATIDSRIPGYTTDERAQQAGRTLRKAVPYVIPRPVRAIGQLAGMAGQQVQNRAGNMAMSRDPLTSAIGGAFEDRSPGIPTGRAARPELMPRATTGQQATAEVAKMIPGLAVGHELDQAGQRMREIEKRKLLPRGSIGWLGEAVKNYGGGFLRGVTVPTAAVESLRGTGDTFRSFWGGEDYARQQAEAAKVQEQTKRMQEISKTRTDAERQLAEAEQGRYMTHQESDAAWQAGLAKAIQQGVAPAEYMKKNPRAKYEELDISGRRRRRQPLTRRNLWSPDDY